MTKKEKQTKKRHRESIPVKSIPVKSVPTRGPGITLRTKNGKYGTAWKGVGTQWKKVGSGWKKGPHSKSDQYNTVTPFSGTWDPNKIASSLPPTFKPYGPLIKKKSHNPKKRKKKVKTRRR